MTEPLSEQEPVRLSSDPDALLMRHFQDGDPASFETLMRKYYARVFAFAYRMTGDRALADDISQDVFIRVHRSASAYQPLARFSTWLFTIAKNTTLNELRRSRRTVTFDHIVNEDVAVAEEASPYERVEEDERAARVRQAIERLPENQRAAVLLRRYENFSYEQIAEALGSSVPAVKSLLSRAKEHLRQSLADLID